MTELEPAARGPVVDADMLKYLGLDPGDVAARALVAVATRYGLDPLLNEIRLIAGKSGAQVYVTRDGLVAIAHRSGQLDGIVVDAMRRNTTDDGWTAYVAVYRKDCAHPFRYGAQCKDSEPQAKAGFGLEQALARAERRALKRAFAISAGDTDGDAHEDLPVGDWPPDRVELEAE